MQLSWTNIINTHNVVVQEEKTHLDQIAQRLDLRAAWVVSLLIVNQEIIRLNVLAIQDIALAGRLRWKV